MSQKNINIAQVEENSSVNSYNTGESQLKGIPSSPGIAYGKVTLIQPENIVVSPETISSDRIPDELEKFEHAVQEILKETDDVLNRAKDHAKKILAVLETNMLILNDEIFLNSIRKRIKKHVSVETAVHQEFDSQKSFLKNAKDALLRDRANDFDQLKQRLLAALRNRQLSYSLVKDSIVVAQSLTPTDVLNFKDSGIRAIVTEVGGITAHSSILARSFGIPEVIGAKGATEIINENSFVIVDGYSGIVTVNPRKENIAFFEIKKKREDNNKKLLGDLIGKKSETSDHREILLKANVDFPEDITAAAMAGADGIGLVRSESIIMLTGQFPTEIKQYNFYKEMADRAYPNPVSIRAFDVGSDKYAEGMSRRENNPALGSRGIRLLLKREDIFIPQLRALLRASKNKNLRLLLPLISCVNELIATRNIIEKIKAELDRNNEDYDRNLPVGIMIETPAAALTADILAEHSDFFSIGTNDLTQYTLAADRTNEFVADIYNSFHPAVLKQIKMVVDSSRKFNIKVSICGELAGHAAATSLLVGIGIDELSVPTNALLELKRRIRSTNFKEAALFTDDVLSSRSFNEVKEKLEIV